MIVNQDYQVCMPIEADKNLLMITSILISTWHIWKIMKIPLFTIAKVLRNKSDD